MHIITLNNQFSCNKSSFNHVLRNGILMKQKNKYLINVYIFFMKFVFSVSEISCEGRRPKGVVVVVVVVVIIYLSKTGNVSYL